MQAPLVPAAVTGTTDPSLTARLNTHLNCASVDDSGIILKTYHKMLHMKYPNAEGSVVLGKTHDEIGASVDVLMGRKTQELVHIADKKTHRPADIVTLDFQLGHRLNGTDIAAALHDEGFKWLVCIFLVVICGGHGQVLGNARCRHDRFQRHQTRRSDQDVVGATLGKDVQTAGRGQGQNCSTPHAFWSRATGAMIYLPACTTCYLIMAR